MAQEAEVSIRRELDEQRATDMNSVGILAAEGGQNRGAEVLAVDGALHKLTAPQNATTLHPDEDALDAFPQSDDHDADQMVTDRPFPKQFYKQDVDKDDAATVNSVGYENQDLDPGDTKKPPLNTKLLQDFRAYCDQHSHNFLDLRKEQESCIKLMDVLQRKAPLNAYTDVLEWHLKETGVLQQHESLKDTQEYQHRKTLMKHLLARYNLKQMVPVEKKVRLPSSKAVVSIPCRDAGDCIVSLLTDPRFQDTDYLFFHDDPLAPPPENVPHLSDLNTGDAYLKTYEKLITHERQCLLAVPLYIDGANTGQFNDLPVTAVKLSLGIHRRETRDRHCAWRELGFVPVVRKDPARGKKILQESGHLESLDVIVLEGEGDAVEPKEAESEQEDAENEAVHAQDFHTMLSVILESFVELQRTGFVWDLVYKGKLYREVEMVIFVPFVKCDTEEADLLCGKYTVRTANVKHVCRYCHCPTDKADDPRAKYKLKTQAEIQNLVERRKLARLQQISQQDIQNAWYDVTFHQANACGIHGACPSEKLHAIQLGIFKYIREIFFVHMGKSSQLAEDVNGLATMYGKLLTRQSERDLPNTNFAKGIQKGKLMARDFRGVLLIMAAVLRSDQGRDLLFQRKKFGGTKGLRDWTLLVELMLEWEAYLCQKSMNRSHLKRLGKKHRFIMFVMRTVARRSSGMGLKVMKFHAILHLIDDMLLYGVPSEFDTGSNESHHKGSKAAARLTQRKESSFNLQTATRLTEFLCIDLAMEEVVDDLKVWEYFKGAEEEDWSSSEDAEREVHDAEMVEEDADRQARELEVRTGGTCIRVCEDDERQGEPAFRILSRSQSMIEGTVWVEEIVDLLNNLQNLVAQHIPEPFLPIMTQHQRGATRFYGHPNFRSSGPWKDWVLVDWGHGHGVLPCHIWCFVGLSGMPIGRERLQFGGIWLEDGVYAVVEVAEYNMDEDEATKSDLFTPLLLDVEMDAEDEVVGRRFYLANTEAFVGPCCVVPNIGGPKNAYLQVKPRAAWAEEFILWLESPHKDDDAEYSDEEESD